MERRRAIAVLGAALLGAVVACPMAACAQTVTPVAKLDLKQFAAPWYEIARLPDKREKDCVSDNLVLYGLRDKKNTFAVVISCQIKNDNWDYWTISGKLSQDGSGRLELVRWFIFRPKYWVIATDPSMQWMVVGTPNHKSLTILSRTPTLAADVLDRVKAQASAQGFNLAKLEDVPQSGTQMNPLVVEHAEAPTVRPEGQPGAENKAK